MKIIHLSCVAPPQTGGIGAVAAKEVELLYEKNTEAVLVAPAFAGSSPLDTGGADGGEVKRVKSINFGNAAILSVHEIMNDLASADVVHLHYPFYGTAGQIARLRRKGVIKKLVVTLHMDAIAGGWKGMIFDLHRKFFQKRILDAADALLVSSKDYARHSSFAPWADHALELPFGVDERVFLPSRASDTATSSRIEVLHVGGMDTAHAFKGVSVLLRAVKELAPQVHVTLIGDGDLRSGFEAEAKKLGIAERVTFAGKVSQAALVAAYQCADLFVFPSTSQAEAFGLAAVEAQSCGVPVVASDLPGVRTVIANGETGFLVPPSDASALAKRIAYLADHADVRRSMGERARRRVLDLFTWNRHVEGLRNIYRDLCASQS